MDTSLNRRDLLRALGVGDGRGPGISGTRPNGGTNHGRTQRLSEPGDRRSRGSSHPPMPHGDQRKSFAASAGNSPFCTRPMFSCWGPARQGLPLRLPRNGREPM